MSNNPLPNRQIHLRKIDIPKQNYSEQEAENQLQKMYKQIESANAELEKVIEEKRKMQEATNKEIQAAKENWEQEKLQYIEQAQQEGYQQGFEQGQKDSLTQYNTIITEAVDVLDNAKQEYYNIVAESDETVLEIAMATSEKVLHQVLEEDPAKFLGIVHSLINQVKDHPHIKLLVSSKYYTLLLENKEELSSILHNQMEFMIYPSADLKEEQVLIETPFGRIDASLDTQLEEIRTRLFHVVEEITRENTNDTK
ncbi:flagellar assembly protein FliH [Gracilibacillus kekensis]|uniref:flagellar assembly protein FliH n=1 Tax=Gracilibacillus kekensis TaxID=1027249 RepID=UPI000ACEC2BD|nr:flagellar assembly protein FliH [Gracilibacillus kekensis]